MVERRHDALEMDPRWVSLKLPFADAVGGRDLGRLLSLVLSTLLSIAFHKILNGLNLAVPSVVIHSF